MVKSIPAFHRKMSGPTNENRRLIALRQKFLVFPAVANRTPRKNVLNKGSLQTRVAMASQNKQTVPVSF